MLSDLKNLEINYILDAYIMNGLQKLTSPHNKFKSKLIVNIKKRKYIINNQKLIYLCADL